MALKKAKREFAIIIHNKAPKDNHQRVIEELNSFFLGEHPLYSGRHGTPQVKMDGSKGTKNCLIEPSHLCVMYSLKEKGE